MAVVKVIQASFDHSNWLALGLLTNTADRIKGHDRLLRSLRFEDEDYAGHALAMVLSIVGENPSNLDAIELYVRETFNAGEFVSSEAPAGRTIVFSPSVFKVPAAPVSPKLVSVMMPFELSFDPVYRAITGAAFVADLEWARADNIWEHSTVIQDVFSLIFRSYIVVCDFSGKNPNVFYEAGIAHTLGKHVIPITQSPDDIPFDLRHHRFIRYLNNDEGRRKLSSDLADRMVYLDRNRA